MRFVTKKQYLKRIYIKMNIYMKIAKIHSVTKQNDGKYFYGNLLFNPFLNFFAVILFKLYMLNIF